MGRSPAVRAGAVRDTLDFLDVFEPGARQKVLSRVPTESRAVIEEMPRSSWVSVEHDHHTIDAMIELFGVERAVECWERSMVHLTEKPLLRGFVSGMRRLFGSDQGRLLTWFPKGWPLAYRDVCTPSVARNPGGTPMIVFEDVADEIKLHPNYFHSWHGACRGFAIIAGVAGDVHFGIAPDLTYAKAIFAGATSKSPSASASR